jgi:hypothetical protein
VQRARGGGFLFSSVWSRLVYSVMFLVVVGTERRPFCGVSFSATTALRGVGKVRQGGEFFISLFGWCICIGTDTDTDTLSLFVPSSSREDYFTWRRGSGPLAPTSPWFC